MTRNHRSDGERARSRRRLVAAGASSVAVLLSGCLSILDDGDGTGASDESDGDGSDTGNETAARNETDEGDGEYTVLADGSDTWHYSREVWYNPVGLYVPIDTTVTWVSRNGAPHSVTAFEDRIPEGATRFASPTLREGETFEHTFSVPGTYDYYCEPEAKAMVGRVVCEEPGGPAEESADGDLPEGDLIVEEGAIEPDV